MEGKTKGNSAVNQNISERFALVSAFTLLFLSTFFLYHYPSILHPSKNYAPTTQPLPPTHFATDDTTSTAATSSVQRPRRAKPACDVSRGEWVRDPDGPYYTNATCRTIQEHQNCMKYGRPDLEFLRWRWRPEECELPLFDPAAFLGIVRGKSIAFVGDSLARNQMQSLMCLLSRVEHPKDISDTTDENFKRMFYASHNFTISSFWSPFLVKAEEGRLEGLNWSGLWNVYLDEPDDRWISSVHSFDYVIVSGGNWFTRPSVFFENRTLVGSNYFLRDNITTLTMYYGHKRAFRTALGAMHESDTFRGMTILRTPSPSHFENGEWNSGGSCRRTRPFKRNETTLVPMDVRLYEDQMKAFSKARREGKRKGLEFRLLDVTRAMLLRPDGHPSRYGHGQEANVTLYNDCVHWCLPGPVDMWNDLLLHTLTF